MEIGHERTLALIEYAQQSALMRGKPVSNVAAHIFYRHESNIAGLPGVHLNASAEDSEDEVWLIVNRLHETKPPEPTSNSLKAWIELPNTPFKEPELKTHIEIQRLIELGLRVDPEQRSDTKNLEPFDPKQIVFWNTFKNRHEVETQLKIYLKNHWAPWAIHEKRRRESISLYATLFTLKQQLEGSIVESQLELVWGAGIAVWKMGDVSVSYPLVSRLVELSFNELTMDIEVRPRDIDPRLELEIYSAEDNQGIPGLERLSKDFFSRSQNIFSPFDRASFEPLLRSAVTHLDPQGVFWPTQTTPEDRALPKAEDKIKVTDTWVLFARPRSSSLFIQDLDRLKKRVEEGLKLPDALTAIVTDPATECIERELPSFRGLSNVQGSAVAGLSQSRVSDLFFRNHTMMSKCASSRCLNARRV